MLEKMPSSIITQRSLPNPSFFQALTTLAMYIVYRRISRDASVPSEQSVEEGLPG
jgi:hypothetical protein